MMRPVLFAVLATALVAPASADDKADLKALVGTWKMEKADLAGMDLTALFKTATLETTADGKYTVTVNGQKDSGTITLDSAKTPKVMTIKSTEGPNKGKTIPAIYKLDGDALTVCYNLDGKDPPTAFATKPDTQLFLATYKRDKK
jgi:uncharacterized protein (TIGR03067 family)